MDRIAFYDSETSSDDSDFEFELNYRPRSAMSDFGDDPSQPRLAPRIFDSEYYSLPPIENLSFNDKEIDKKSLKPFGSVISIIDFVVTIKPHDNVPSLDYDTALFNENAEFLGSIFEIFGLIAEPMYAIRFNNAEEAQKCQIGMAIMYAPENFDLTHKTFIDSITSKNKGCDDGDGEPEFSDDEAERQYLQKKKAKQRTPADSLSVPPSKQFRGK